MEKLIKHESCMDMDTLGNRVRELRKKKGLTQAQLGCLAGVHHTNIGRIENKEVIPQANVLYLIAKNLNTSVEWLLTGKSSMAHSQASLESVENMTQELLEKYSELNKQEKEEVLDYLNFVLFKREL